MSSLKQILLEQPTRDQPLAGTTHEKLPDNEQSGPIPSAKYRGCTIVLHTDGVRYKECPVGQTSPLAGSGYTGTYFKDIVRNATVSEEADGLKIKYLNFNEFYVTPVENTPDVFLDEDNGVRATFRRNNQNKVIELKLKFEGVEVLRNFGSVVVLPKTSEDTEGGGGTTPRIDLRQRYDTSGDFGCLELVRRELNRFPFLYRDENGNRLAYEYLSTIVDGSSTELEYNKDKTVFWRKRSEDHDILKKGTWECVGDGYIITWEDGKKTTFGVDDVDINGGSAPNGSSQSTSNNSSSSVKLTSCKSGYNIPCPDEQDVLDGKASWRACMSCDMIQELQEIPALKDKIERIQTRDGKTITTDIYFGPIMEEAVILLQAERGLTPDGKIGEMTYNELLSNPGISSTSSGNNTGASTTPTTTTTTPTPKSQTKPSQPIRKVNIFDPNADY